VVDHVLRRIAEGAIVEGVPQGKPWASDRSLVDRDGDPMPEEGEVAEWLERALTSLRAETVGRGLSIDVSVEVGETIESLWADGGLRASRLRRRAWATAVISGDGTSPRPVVLAARRWADLDSQGLRRRLAAREATASGGQGRTLLLTPEASAILVSALVRSIHVEPMRGQRCGPGWQVVDDPTAAGAVLGGSFDDDGFPTFRAVLAWGGALRRGLGHRGQGRRPSFREPPCAHPSQLQVLAPEVEPPPDTRRAAGLRIHLLEPGRMVLELERAGGREPWFVATTPDDVVCGCIGGVGPAESHHPGVTTPALAFEGLF
jgi:hypothetical protein